MQKYLAILILILVLPCVSPEVILGAEDSADRSDSLYEKIEPRQPQKRISPAYTPEALPYADGWLIVNGSYIPGPYDVAVVGSTIVINRIVVSSHRTGKTRRLSSSIPADRRNRHEFTTTLSAKFKVWVKKYGLEDARERSLEYTQNHELTDTAYMRGPATLRYVFKGQTIDEGISLMPPREYEFPAYERAFRVLNGQARHLRKSLSTGGLVIFQNGKPKVYRAPTGEKKWNRLLSIFDSEMTLDEKNGAIEIVVGDSTIAAFMARYFDPNSVGQDP